MPNNNVPQTYVQLLDARRDEIKALLPDYLDLERFLYNAKTLSNNRDLQGCRPDALIECAVDAARRGLEIGGPNKHCAVVPFKTKSGGVFPVLIVQWQGKSFLWQRSGAIKALRARCVYKWDSFEYDAGENTIKHVPDIDTPHSPKELNNIENIRGAYAIATSWSGERLVSFVGHNELVRLMEWTKAKNDGSLGFGWRDWLPEMCCKTAVHRLDGFAQPPPNMTPEQIDAWNRAGQAESTQFDAETTGEEVHVELPVDTGGNPAATPNKGGADETVRSEASPQGRVAGNPSSPGATGGSSTISKQDCDDIYAVAGKDLDALEATCAHYGISDPSLLPASNLKMFIKRLEVAVEANRG